MHAFKMRQRGRWARSAPTIRAHHGWWCWPLGACANTCMTTARTMFRWMNSPRLRTCVYFTSTVFRMEIGLPPHAYRTQLRVLRSRALLARGMAIDSVAVEVGFFD